MVLPIMPGTNNFWNRLDHAYNTKNAFEFWRLLGGDPLAVTTKVESTTKDLDPLPVAIVSYYELAATKGDLDSREGALLEVDDVSHSQG